MMSVAHKDSIAMAKETYEKTMANIRHRVIHNIVDEVLKLQGEGRKLHLSLDFGGCIYIYNDSMNSTLKINGNAYFSTVEQLTDALGVLEAMRNPLCKRDEEVAAHAEAISRTA